MKKLYITNNTILLAHIEEKGILTGYDLLTEKLVKVPKYKTIQMTNSVIKLLGDEKARYLVSKNLSKDDEKRAEIMNVGIRTFYRKKLIYDSFE